MLKNGAQWCARHQNYKIEKRIIKNCFGFNIGSIEPNYAYIYYLRKNVFFSSKKKFEK